MDDPQLALRGAHPQVVAYGTQRLDLVLTDIAKETLEKNRQKAHNISKQCTNFGFKHKTNNTQQRSLGLGGSQLSHFLTKICLAEEKDSYFNLAKILARLVIKVGYPLERSVLDF